MDFAEAYGLTGTQSLLERIEVALLAYDLGSKSAYLSEAAAKIHGYTRQDFRENPRLWEEAVHPEDKGRLAEFISDWERGMIRDCEYRIRRPDGEIRWVTMRCSGVFSDAGELTRIEGIMHDITAAKGLEEANQESQEGYRTLVEHSPQPIVVVQDEKVVYANWATAKVFNLTSPRDILNKSIYKFVDASDFALVRSRMTRPFSHQDIGSSEVHILLTNGKCLIAELLSVPMLYKGRPSYLVMGSDISERKEFEHRLAESEARYRNLVEVLPQPVLVHQQGVISYVNPAAVEVLEAGSQAEIVGRSMEEFIFREEQEILKMKMDEILERQAPLCFDDRFRTLKGHVIDIEVTAIGVTYRGSQAVLGIFRDITEQKSLKQALIDAESKYRSLVEGALIGVYLVQGENFIYINPYIEEAFGYTVDDLNAKAVAEFVFEEDRALFQESLELFRTGSRKLTRQFRVVKKNGEVADVEIHVEVTVFNREPALIGTVQDITCQKKTTREIREMAYTDALTGLPNRHALKDYLTGLLVEANQLPPAVGIMFMDLDRFKLINDTLGHETGDYVLKETANRLKRCIRKEDIVSRYGGDEFIVILHETDRAGIQRVAQRILNELNQNYHYDQEELSVTPSMGISIYPFDGEDAQTLIKNADTAMYSAKELGKNNYQFYSATLSSQYSRKMKLDHALRRALENKELMLYYQPQIHLETGEIIGFESLARWNHPEYGMVPPSEFIPIAEEIGQIVPIGQWVLETACRQNKAWQEAGYPAVPMAVNISGYQFLQPDFVDRVKDILADTGLEPRYLELEMTESTMKNVSVLIPILTEFQGMGIRISIDDFGTGYSSLSLIKNLPIDVIKIDKSFVQDMFANEASSSIVKAIIEMGACLNSQLIAEGIEHEDEVEFLKKTHCQVGQGYLFARPLPTEEIETIIKKRLRQAT